MHIKCCCFNIWRCWLSHISQSNSGVSFSKRPVFGYASSIRYTYVYATHKSVFVVISFEMCFSDKKLFFFYFCIEMKKIDCKPEHCIPLAKVWQNENGNVLLSCLVIFLIFYRTKQFSATAASSASTLSRQRIRTLLHTEALSSHHIHIHTYKS